MNTYLLILGLLSTPAGIGSGPPKASSCDRLQAEISLIKFSPYVADGTVRGWAVGPLAADMKLFHSGLRAQDLVTAISGNPVLSLEAFQLGLKQLCAPAASLGLMRSGKPMVIPVNLPRQSPAF